MRVSIINKRIAFLGLLFLAIFSLLLQTKAASQSDAIAVRVLPNINNESIDVWYTKQGFQGSPQSLVVDGYEAIRNGRTVFINAANLDEVNKKIYTNIYLISYNQESDNKTMDILGQLISHWKFNNNINTAGTCSIATKNCTADSDCLSDQLCSNDDTDLNKGKCVLKEQKSCLIDSDCSVNFFCDSLKARAIRDVKRLGNLNIIKQSLESFKNLNNYYPKLESGTYFSGNTISVWPSWKETFSSQLGLNMVLNDPINSLGYCENFEAKTCWNNQTNKFVNDNLILPQGSYAFIYKTVPNGVTYNLCSVFETGNLGYDTTQGVISKNKCSVTGSYSGDVKNSAPVLMDYYLNGESGREFSGYLKVKDAEGDLVSWSLSSYNPENSNNNESSHYNYWVSWSKIPELQEAGDPNQKKISAPVAGNPGVYDMYLTLTDSRGAVNVNRITITISSSNKPRIEATDVDYFVDPVVPLNYTFYLTGNNSTPTYTITPLNPDHTSLSIANFAKSSSKITSVGLNKIKVDLSFLILTSVPVVQDVSLPFRITALADGASSTKDIKVNLKIEKPLLDFDCGNMARIGNPYPLSGAACLLGKTNSGNHSLEYQAKVSSDSSHIYVVNNKEQGFSYLYSLGVAAKNPTSTDVTVSVKNEYGATAEKTFKVNLNNFCGDGIKQTPNSEGAGGLYNDGVEQCDGWDGIWSRKDVMSQTPSLQYACTSGLKIKSPYPILDNKSCIFKDSTAGGGYCGDGYCQAKIINPDGDLVEMETCGNCSQDCGKCVCTPRCDGKTCGDDGCGGTCGECGASDVCVGGSCCPTSANIQVCADNYHSTYFNGLKVSSTEGTGCGTICGTVNDATQGCCWAAVQKFSTNLKSGKNVMAIKAIDTGGVYGFSATLNSGTCKNMTTDDLANWKCIKSSGPITSRWSFVDFDDSSWFTPIVTGTKGIRDGNYLEYQQIWSPDADHSTSSVYCRYTFNTEAAYNEACVPSCEGKCSGPDGCGGICRDNCLAPQTCGGALVANVCGYLEEDLKCNSNCVNKCGGPDGCGGVCPNTCRINQSCVSDGYVVCKDIYKKEDGGKAEYEYMMQW